MKGVPWPTATSTRPAPALAQDRIDAARITAITDDAVEAACATYLGYTWGQCTDAFKAGRRKDMREALEAAFVCAGIATAGTQWTRVEDGLPEPDCIVQLTVLCEDGEREIRHTRYRGRDDGWRGVGTYVRPLAWAPLTEPWRG